jgi:glycosyltransferase involved in cell wall biosynthesis
MNKKTITVSVISELTTDQRVIRICTTLQEMGFEVQVIARRFSNSLPPDDYIFKAKRLRCFFRRGFMQFAEFNFKLFCVLMFVKTDYFLANDLDTLIPNYVGSTLRRKKMFYDTHEYYTGVPELKNSLIKKRIWKFFENWIFPKLKVVYTVNESIKNLYNKEYGNNLTVIKNVPVTERVDPRTLPNQWKGKIILLMQGAGINNNRGGMELLESMNFLPDNYHLVYIGDGNLWNTIGTMRTKWKLEKKVEMIKKMPPSELKKYTPLAHLGFSLDGFTDINFLYNLPNKIFDYIHAGVPVVATAIPEVKAIMEEYGCGVCTKSQDPREIAGQVKSIMDNYEYYQKLRRNALIAAKELCWEKEKGKLVAIYQPYL